MKELVFLKGKQALTDSLKVAEYFGKRHDRLLQTIETEYGDLHEFVEMFRKATYLDSYGRQQPMYFMNRDGFFMLVTGFKGAKAKQFKLAFIKAFNAMEQILLNWRNAEWQEIRESTKRGNRAMCDVIHDYVIPLARANGSTTPDDKFYMTYQKAVNKAAGVQPKSRDTQPLSQLYEIEKIQDMVGVSIKGQVARGEHDHKQIYRGTNQLITDYSRISLIPERFLPA